MSEAKPSPHARKISRYLEGDIHEFLDKKIIELDGSISRMHLEKILVDKFGAEKFEEHKASLSDKLSSCVEKMERETAFPAAPAEGPPKKPASAKRSLTYRSPLNPMCVSQLELPSSNAEETEGEVAVRGHRSRRSLSLPSKFDAELAQLIVENEAPFQQLKFARNSLFKKKKEGVLFTTNLPSQVKGPDRYCVGCVPCHGNLRKRHKGFWQLHDFELRNLYIVHRSSPIIGKQKIKRAPTEKVRGAYSLAELSSVTIENEKEIVIKFKSETATEEAKVFKAETAEDAKRWHDAMQQRMREMQARSKYTLHWEDLPVRPRGLACLDFDRTLLKEHTFQRANDLGVKGLKKVPLEELVKWFGGQERLDATKAWLLNLWNKHRVALVVISLGRTAQVLLMMRRLGLLDFHNTIGLQGVVGSKPCVFGYDKGVSVQECCYKAWDRVWAWALRQKHRVQALPVYFADDSKRNVAAVRKTCGLSEEQLMFVDKDKAIDEEARNIITKFFTSRLVNVHWKNKLPTQHKMSLQYPLRGMIGMYLHTKCHKRFADETYVQVLKLKNNEDGSPGSAEVAGILKNDRIDCIDNFPVRNIVEVKYYLKQVHIKDPSRVQVKVVVLRLPTPDGAVNRSGWSTR